MKNMVPQKERDTQFIRRADHLTKQGGEFIAYYTESKLRMQTEQLRVMACVDPLTEKEFFVTMTFGICEGAKDADLEQIISQADKRLYKGKNNGRDHVEYTD